MKNDLFAGKSCYGRYWARTSDPLLVRQDFELSPPRDSLQNMGFLQVGESCRYSISTDFHGSFVNKVSTKRTQVVTGSGSACSASSRWFEMGGN
jgi:hypothetical protein